MFRKSHYSPDIIWVIKFRTVGWVEHAARTEGWQFLSAYRKAKYHWPTCIPFRKHYFNLSEEFL